MEIDSEYVSKLCIGIVGSRMLAEMLWRVGVGTIKYIGDFITQQDVFSDVSISFDDANDYDVVESRSNTLVISYLAEELDESEFIRAFRGCDVIVAHRYVDLSAIAAEKFGVALIPPIVTCILPEDLKEYSKIIAKLSPPKNPMMYAMLCSAQVLELLRLCIDGSSLIAPDAMVPAEEKPFFRKIKLW